MKKYIVLMFVFLAYCHPTKNVTRETKIPFELPRNFNLPRYKVIKIDSIDNVYVIYAEKDSLFYKIVSSKIGSIDCKNLNINGRYGFMLRSLFQLVVLGTHDTLPRRMELVNAVKYNGSNIVIEKGYVDDIYTADNVVGLCIKYQ